MHGMSCTISHAVSCQPLTTETWIQSQASPRGICGGKCGNETGSSLSISVLLCQYHHTNAQCSLIHKLSHYVQYVIQLTVSLHNTLEQNELILWNRVLPEIMKSTVLLQFSQTGHYSLPDNSSPNSHTIHL